MLEITLGVTLFTVIVLTLVGIAFDAFGASYSSLADRSRLPLRFEA